MSEPNASARPTTPDFRRCRCLTVKGVPCNNRALLGHDLCYNHQNNRFPVFPTGPAITVPLLDNMPSVQLVNTQIMQGLFSGAIEPARANSMFYGCRGATLTIGRPAPLQQPTTPEEPVTEVFTGPDGQHLGPALPWNGPNAVFEPIWSIDKYRYELECERLNIPKPTGPADMPECGWLTPEETIERENDLLGTELKSRFKEQTLQLRIEADQRGALPPLKERKQCAYNNENYCGGAGSHRNHQCEFCQRERDENDRLPKDALPAPAAASAPTPAILPNLQAAAAQPRIRPAKRNHPPVVHLDNITKSLILKGAQHPPTPGRAPQAGDQLPAGCPRSARVWQMWETRAARPHLATSYQLPATKSCNAHPS
ncbi:MAG: hypothetical protein WA414_17265 [Acidobacteriaceae bacterium]